MYKKQDALNKIRFTKQHKNDDCLITNIINLRKWAGIKSSYRKDAATIHKKYLQSTKEGTRLKTNQDAYIEAVKNKAFNIRNILGPSIDQLIEPLNNNDCIVFSFHPKHEIERGRAVLHDILIIDYDSSDEIFLCTNVFKQKGPAIQKIKYNIIYDYISYNRKMNYRVCSSMARIFTKDTFRKNYNKLPSKEIKFTSLYQKLKAGIHKAKFGAYFCEIGNNFDGLMPLELNIYATCCSPDYNPFFEEIDDE